MIKRFGIVLLVLSMLILSACGDTEQADSSSEKNSKQESGTVNEVTEYAPYVREDGYTVWDLQKMDFDEFPNIITHGTLSNKTVNCLLCDQTSGSTKESENCTDKTGASGQFDRIIQNGQVYEWGSLNDSNWADILAEINTWLPIKRWKCAVGQETAEEYTEQDKDLLNQSAEFFTDRVMSLYEVTKAMPSLDIIFQDDTFAVKFEFYFVVTGDDKDTGTIDTIGVFANAVAGCTDEGYFQAEFDNENLVINLADEQKILFEVLKYSRD